jgi:hypothetical protein
LCDQGYKLNDLFRRNIILTQNNEIKFIDFGANLIDVYANGIMKTYTDFFEEEKSDEIMVMNEIPEKNRMTKVQLLQNLMRGIIPNIRPNMYLKNIESPDNPYHSILVELNIVTIGGKRISKKKNRKSNRTTKNSKKGRKTLKKVVCKNKP